MYTNKYKDILILKNTFLLLFILNFSLLFGQDNPLPTNEQNPKRSYKWNALALRVGMGYQYSFYTELGLSFIHHEFDSEEGMGNLIFFAAHHWTPVNGVMGVKVGTDLNTHLGVIGVEFNYQLKNDQTDFVFTPKYGFGFGFCNIIYGYNFSSNKWPFYRIKKHQIALIFNISNKFFQRYNSKPIY